MQRRSSRKNFLPLSFKVYYVCMQVHLNQIIKTQLHDLKISFSKRCLGKGLVRMSAIISSVARYLQKIAPFSACGVPANENYPSSVLPQGKEEPDETFCRLSSTFECIRHHLLSQITFDMYIQPSMLSLNVKRTFRSLQTTV